MQHGDKVHITIRSWLAPRNGIYKHSHIVDTVHGNQITRHVIELPHKRTKSKSFQVSCQTHEFVEGWQ